MSIQGETSKLVSTFLIASLASNIAVPQYLGESLDLDDSEQLNSVATPVILSIEEYLYLTPEFQELKDSIDPIVIGETSFISPKIPPNKKQVVISKKWLFATAYSSTPDQTDSTPFITASGSHVRDGIVAANFLRFGTKIRIPTIYGDKIFVVEDRMNSRYKYRVDIWMRTREEAKQFGAKIILIEIIKEI